jgi:hypothetical protein
MVYQVIEKDLEKINSYIKIRFGGQS